MRWQVIVAAVLAVGGLAGCAKPGAPTPPPGKYISGGEAGGSIGSHQRMDFSPSGVSQMGSAYTGGTPLTPISADPHPPATVLKGTSKN